MPNTVTNEKIISATYVALYQRSPDQAGLQYWSNKAAELQLAGKTGNDLAKEMANLFAQHPAFTSLYGTLGDVAYIDAIYMNIGGKAADANGRAFWLSKLTDATNPASRAEIVGEFVYTILSITSAELQAQKDAGQITQQELDDALARQDRLNNKSDVALKFTQAMGVGSNLSPGTDPNSLESLEKDPVYLASKAIIKGVTEDDATMTAPTTYLDGTPTITGINQQFGGGVVDGKTYALTVGADDIIGTAGDDTINAVTVNGQGTAATTLQAFDKVDGGAGTDTLNIYVTATENATQQGTVKNVEIVNIVDDGAGSFGGGAGIDASKFVGATQLWQVNAVNATGVTKLASGVTAGFRDIAGAALNVDVADAATSVAVALDGVDDAAASDVVVTAGAASKLASATISGTVIDDGTGDGVDAIDVTIEAGLNVKSFSFTTEVDVNLVLNENGASTVNIESFDGSASTGDIAFTTDADLKATKTGSGDDIVTLGADLAAGASVATNAGDDTVDLNGQNVAATATVNLGAGDDVFADLAGGSVVDLGAVLDGGDGEDTLQLQLVGAANVAAFKNFEIFDVRGLDHDVDLDILASKNTVTKISASGAAGADANLENVGAGVSYEVTGDMDANIITLTQKTAGALTITSNVDELAADAAAEASDAVVVAANATSLNIVFDNNNIDKLADGYANTARLDVTAGSGNGTTGVKGATSVAVVSGGSEVVNTLNLTAVATSAAGTAELLTSITVTGTQALVLDRVASGGTLKLASVDASGQTAGGLTFNLDDLTTTGTLKLGAGDDVITGEIFDTTAAVTTAALITINGFKKGTAADAAKQDGFDVLKFAGAIQSAAYNNADFSVANGKVTWKGAGPANLDAAITTLEAILQNNETVVFSLGGSEYFIFGAGADSADKTDDLLIKLTGVTSVTGLDTEAVNNDIYLF